MTERQILDALAARYNPPAYAFLEHVADATGMRHSKTIDGVAMGLWPSRGLDLHGFEVKCDRRDWLRELKQPAKAEGWRFDYFWLVACRGVVLNLSEVPKPWGYLLLRDSGRWSVEREAPARKPEALSRFMLAALMRKLHAAVVDGDALAAKYRDGIAEGQRSMQAVVDNERQTVQRERDALALRVANFEKESGLKFDRWENGLTLGKLVAAARLLQPPTVLARLGRLDSELDGLRQTSQTIRELLTGPMGHDDDRSQDVRF